MASSRKRLSADPAAAVARFLEEHPWRGRAAVALSVAAHNGLCSSHISLFGNEEQKQKFLVPLVP